MKWVAGGFRSSEATAAPNWRDVACVPLADYYVLRPGCYLELIELLGPVRDGVYARPEE